MNKKSIFLWSIERNQIVEGYMFGTIHVPFTEVWEQVSEKVKIAFARSDSVVFELDLYNANTIKRLMECKNIPGGDMKLYRKRLEQEYRKVERSETKEELRKHFRFLFENIAGWERRRPVWLLFLLYQLSEKHVYKEQTPMLDLFLAQYALELNKKLFSIETAAEQCNPLRSMRIDQVVFAINYTLSYLESEHQLMIKGRQSNNSGISNLINSYKCGSLDESLFNADSKRFMSHGFSISAELDKKAQEIDIQLREDIIERRNVRMADRIAKLLQWKAGNQYFFALGAGHFLGHKSILALLKSHGFITKAVSEDDDISFRDYTNNKRVYVFNELWVRDGNFKDVSAIDVLLTVNELPRSKAKKNRSHGVAFITTTMFLFFL
ncbi:unnamed protein product [Thelazia callipaeda]|uniref:Metalloprotease TIKI homolog n=1 Tax=Thelazia callipaeda TaxID=103827 RepID=A0A0N5CUN0_THECL|nr:unnamed protein product [Thelazia callipaeda]